MKSGINSSSPMPLRDAAERVAQAARRLPEVTPLGMNHSPYPDRFLPRDDLSEADLKELAKRTLTNL